MDGYPFYGLSWTCIKCCEAEGFITPDDGPLPDDDEEELLDTTACNEEANEPVEEAIPGREDEEGEGRDGNILSETKRI